MDIGRLDPDYKPVTNFLAVVEDCQNQYREKLFRLAVDIGNYLRKIKQQPGRKFLFKLKQYFIKSQWFKKVQIKSNKLLLFRRKGQFAIVLSQAQIYSLKSFAKEIREQSLNSAY